MDIIIVFALLAFSVTATAWLSYVAGRRVGYQKGYRAGVQHQRYVYNSFYGKPQILSEMIEEHNKRIGL